MAALTVPQKVRASSLLEVIIAMVLITVIFGLAMMIFTNVTRMSLSAKKLQATALLHQTLRRMEQEAHPADQTLQLEDFKVEVRVTTSSSYPGMQEIHVIAYDINQLKVAELSKLIPGKDD